MISTFHDLSWWVAFLLCNIGRVVLVSSPLRRIQPTVAFLKYALTPNKQAEAIIWSPSNNILRTKFSEIYRAINALSFWLSIFIWGEMIDPKWIYERESSEREKNRQTDRKRQSMLLFAGSLHTQMATVRTGWSWNQDPGTPSLSQM